MSDVPHKCVIHYREICLRPYRTSLRERLGLAMLKTEKGRAFLEFENRWEIKNYPRWWRRDFERWTVVMFRPERHLIIRNFSTP